MTGAQVLSPSGRAAQRCLADLTQRTPDGKLVPIPDIHPSLGLLRAAVAAYLEMVHRHLSGRYFKKDNQASLACPIRGPVLEDNGVHGDPTIKRLLWRSVAMHKPAVPNRTDLTSCAGGLPEAFIRCPESEFPHCSVGWERRYDGCAQSLIVGSLCPRNWLKLRKTTLDQAAGLTGKVLGNLRYHLLLERIADVHCKISEYIRADFRVERVHDYLAPVDALEF